MRQFDARRYIAIETAVSVIINIVMTVTPSAIALSGQQTVLISAQGMAPAIAAPMFMSAFMSALVPSLLTRRRYRNGKLQSPLHAGGPTVFQAVSAALFLAASLTLLGMFLTSIVSRQWAGESLRVEVVLLVYGAYGGILAALVTPAALILLFGRGWRTGFGQDKRVGDRPGPLVDRLLRGGL